MKQELLEHSADSLAIMIVWTPMMESDNEEAANRSATMFDPERVSQFYDPHRRVGNAFRKQVFPNAYDEALGSLPADHWMRESMPAMKERYASSPEWDIYMFFGPGLEWHDAPPHPTRFVRHLGRIIEKDSERLSLMWIDAYANPPVEGKLPVEVGRLGHELLDPKASRR